MVWNFAIGTLPANAFACVRGMTVSSAAPKISTRPLYPERDDYLSLLLPGRKTMTVGVMAGLKKELSLQCRAANHGHKVGRDEERQQSLQFSHLTQAQWIVMRKGGGSDTFDIQPGAIRTAPCAGAREIAQADGAAVGAVEF